MSVFGFELRFRFGAALLQQARGEDWDDGGVHLARPDLGPQKLRIRRLQVQILPDAPIKSRVSEGFSKVSVAHLILDLYTDWHEQSPKTR